MNISSQHHSFDILFASKFGVEESILIHHFQHWIRINRYRNRNIHDGHCWTYQTRTDIQAHFPYWNVDRVKYLCEKLVSMGILITGNYNKKPMDHTLWYAFADEKQFGVDDESSNNFYDKAKVPNRKGKSAHAIPDSIQDTKPIEEDVGFSNSEKKERPPKRRSTAPPIRFNLETNDFEGIRLEDLKEWKATFTAISVEQELRSAKLWAKTVRRNNYRRSLNSWMDNANKNHTTAYRLPDQAPQFIGTEAEQEQNQLLAKKWEKNQEPMRNNFYWIDAKNEKIEFGLPNNSGYTVSYVLPTKEFIEKCKAALIKMRINHD